MFITNDLITLVNDAVVDLELFAADAANLQIALVINNFTPAYTTNPGAVTIIDSDGLNPKVVVKAGGMLRSIWNVPNGRWGYLLREPAGGFTFIATTVPDPAVTVYGFILSDNATPPTMVYASALLPAPVPITAVGQAIELSGLLGYLFRPPIGDLPAIPG